jgi:DnaK suppressor protein
MLKLKKKNKDKKATKVAKLAGGKLLKKSGSSKLKLKSKAARREAKEAKSSRPKVRQTDPADAKRYVKAPPIKLTREMIEIRERLQGMLTDMRRDIDHEVRGASARDLAHINDTSDMASDAAEGDLALRIAESETVEASEIERAIEKIDTGTYGQCEMCNAQIGADRLKFLPYVTLCIKCQELAEIRSKDEGNELDDLAEGSDADSENN